MAILVWDNKNFEKETPSGKGTTHNINGVIVQRIVPDHDESDGIELALDVSIPRDRKRSFQSRSSDLAIFRGQKKAPPQVMDKSLMEDDSRVTVQEAARRHDIAYVLTRMP